MANLLKREAWLSELLGGALVASGVGSGAAAWTVSRWLTRRSPGRPRATPDSLGLSWQRLECHTADKLRLVGWEVSPPRARATVVLFHGMRGNRARTLNRTAFLAAAGYRCIAFDHRAHGESDGRTSSFGYHEARDVAAVVAAVRRRWPGQPVAGFGVSMGAAALCYAAEQTRCLDAVVLESVYYDVARAFETRLRDDYPRWFRQLAGSVVRVTERRLGVRLDQLTPWRHIADLSPAPVLFLTGDADAHAPPTDVRRLYDRCLGPREFYIVPGAGHLDVCEKGGPDYRERVLAFLGRHLRGVAC